MIHCLDLRARDSFCAMKISLIFLLAVCWVPTPS